MRDQTQSYACFPVAVPSRPRIATRVNTIPSVRINKPPFGIGGHGFVIWNLRKIETSFPSVGAPLTTVEPGSAPPTAFEPGSLSSRAA